jgi:hypothetical protein
VLLTALACNNRNLNEQNAATFYPFESFAVSTRC